MTAITKFHTSNGDLDVFEEVFDASIDTEA